MFYYAKSGGFLKNDKRSIQRICQLLSLYMLLTIFMYMISPFTWNTYKPWRLYILVITYIFSFYLGSLLATVRKPQDKTINHEILTDTKEKVLKYLFFALPITLLYTLSYLIFNLQAVGLSGNLLTQIVSAISDMSVGYAEKGSIVPPKALNYITVLCGPIFVSATFFGFLYFRDLQKSHKRIVIFLTISEVLRWLIIGTGKGAITSMIYLAVSLLLRKTFLQSKDDTQATQSHQKKTGWVRIFVIILLAVVIFGFVGINRSGGTLSASLNKGINKDHFLFKILPQELALIVCRIFSYVCQGYYGMSLTAHVDWKCTYGFGYSGFIRQRLTNIQGVDTIWSRTYQHRIFTYGWDETSNWHTMYVWFANDISFIGVTFLMFFFGLLLTKSLYDGFYNGNIFAMVVSFLIINVIIFSSMNNQVFANPDTFMTFYSFLLLWIASHSKRKLVLVKKRTPFTIR